MVVAAGSNESVNGSETVCLAVAIYEGRRVEKKLRGGRDEIWARIPRL